MSRRRRLCVDLCPVADPRLQTDARGAAKYWFHQRDGQRLPASFVVQAVHTGDGAIIRAIEAFTGASSLAFADRPAVAMALFVGEQLRELSRDSTVIEAMPVLIPSRRRAFQAL